jgi:hypothetical protein
LQAFCDLEPVFTWEGTYDINALVTGREITGITSFKPVVLAKARYSMLYGMMSELDLFVAIN